MRISIIMVSRNAEKTIERSLLSLLSQDYKDKEIIVIDGASTDRTCDLIKKYNEKISYFISESDKNPHDAINKGIRVATGEFIGFLNADDWYLNEHVLTDVSQEILPETDVFCGNLFLQINGKWKRKKADKNLNLLYFKGCIPILASFFSRHVFEKCGFLDVNYKYSGDYEFWLRLYTKQMNFQFSEQYITLMFDGGLSSDPRKGCYQEDRKIVVKYGVPPFQAEVRYWKKYLRYTLILMARKMKIDNFMKKFLGYEAYLSEKEMDEIGIHIQNPWFLK